MQHARMVSQRMVSGARWLQAAVRPGVGVGGLAGLLLLPLDVGAVGSGDLDTSFGGDGTVHTNFGSGADNYARALAIQSNGKIVVAGESTASGLLHFAVARYLPNGTLDATFSGDGKVRTDFRGGSHANASALAIQPRDGRLVVAGWFGASDLEEESEVFALARYHAITCNGVVATRVGTAGHDTLMGTAGPDVIVGFDGDLGSSRTHR
jgi:uncharacterized delta-60 repeat protein